jgi:predicted nucleic acid-binding protein
MTAFPKRCVVDASVGIRIFLPEEHSVEIRAWFGSSLAQKNPQLLVPDLFFAECANILWKRVQRGQYDSESAKANIADLRALDLVSTPCADLAERALEIACLYGITAYDACYAALSESADAPLITADLRLRNRLLKQFNVLLLGE